MAGDDRARRHRQHFGHRGVAGVRDIDDHAERLHPAHHLAAERRQPALGDAMHRAGHVVIEEMRKAGHAEAGGVEHIQIGDIALEILQALDRQHAAHDRIAASPIGQQAIEVRWRRDQPEPPARPFGKAFQFFRMP